MHVTVHDFAYDCTKYLLKQYNIQYNILMFSHKNPNETNLLLLILRLITHKKNKS